MLFKLTITKKPTSSPQLNLGVASICDIQLFSLFIKALNIFSIKHLYYSGYYQALVKSQNNYTLAILVRFGPFVIFGEMGKVQKHLIYRLQKMCALYFLCWIIPVSVNLDA